MKKRDHLSEDSRFTYNYKTIIIVQNF